MILATDSVVLDGALQGQEAHRKETNIPGSSRSDFRNVDRERYLGSSPHHGEPLMLGFDVSERTIFMATGPFSFVCEADFERRFETN